MLKTTTRVKPNVAEVAAKVIDGEAIIMNLSNGLYFSMDSVGATVWEMVEAGAAVDEMAGHLERSFDVDRDRALEDVLRLVDQLLAENLILVSETNGNGLTPPASGASTTAYSSPVLNKYDDMADLLALDPPMPGLGNLPDEG